MSQITRIYSVTGTTSGTGQTIGAVTANILTLNLGAVPTVFIVEAKVVGFDPLGPAGIVYNLLCGVRTTGIASAIIKLQDIYTAEEASLAACDARFVTAGNTLIVQVTGAAGRTINWVASTTTIGV